MRLPVLALSCLLLLPAIARGEASQSDQRVAPTIQLFTMGQGEMLFGRFGHTAICVQVPDASDKPQCYNYGTTDFTRPLGLTVDVLRGRADVWVSRYELAEILELYRTEDRTVWSQDLPLTAEEAVAVWDRVQAETAPESLHFTYDHVADNCTTRPRDIIDAATGGRLREGTDELSGMTVRRYARRAFADDTWLLLVTDLFVGRAADEPLTRWQTLFLPAELQLLVQERFDVDSTELARRQGPEFGSSPGSGGRWLVLLFALLLALPVGVARRFGKKERAAAALPGLFLGLLGLAVWTLALLSTVPALRWNEAALIFLPSDLLLPLLSAKWRVRYARGRLALLAVVFLLLIIGVLIQPIWLWLIVSVAPLALLALKPVSAVESPASDRSGDPLPG